MIYTDTTHLISSESIEELHEFAEQIGLNRCYFEGVRKGHPHYDLKNKNGDILFNKKGESYIESAIRWGAIVVKTRVLIETNEIRKRMGPPCKRHKMRNQTMSYVAHAEWMEKMVKAGRKCKQCRICGRYLFACEV